jgi:uncharacterized protein (TIGR00255 family)
MTGFARGGGANETLSWSWEAKSVNGKGLDIRTRMPHGFEELEIEARKMTQQNFKRGSINIGLTVRQTEGRKQFQINRELLDGLIETAGELAADGLEKPRLDGLLAVRGVVDFADEAEGLAAGDGSLGGMKGSLEEVLGALAHTRDEEGGRIAKILGEQLESIAAACGEAESAAAMQPQAIRQRLARQVAELTEDRPELPEERLAQEAALLMTKADVREELDRLSAHLEAARELLAEEGAIGRRLDFLCQELNREANTICSKAADLELTRIGLEIKAMIEQFREQVQNIE